MSNKEKVIKEQGCRNWKKFRVSPIHVRAYRWTRLGDIPDVVKEIPYKGLGATTCARCGKVSLDTHGMMEVKREDTTKDNVYVCPGSWIVEYPWGEYKLYPEENFETEFDELK